MEVEKPEIQAVEPETKIEAPEKEDATHADSVQPSADKGVDRAKSAERIRELNSIDQDVTRSLQAAGKAIKALTHPATNIETDGGESSSTPLEASKKAFETHTKEYYALVQSVSARLRRQIYALEEAGIIAPNQASMEHQTAPAAPASKPAGAARNTGARTGTTAAVMLQQRVEPPMEITNGGLGNLDVGWLNSRSDKVEVQMESELWAQAREQLEKLGIKPIGNAESENSEVVNSEGLNSEGENAGSDGMDVDEQET